MQNYNEKDRKYVRPLSYQPLLSLAKKINVRRMSVWIVMEGRDQNDNRASVLLIKAKPGTSEPLKNLAEKDMKDIRPHLIETGKELGCASWKITTKGDLHTIFFYYPTEFEVGKDFIKNAHEKFKMNQPVDVETCYTHFNKMKDLCEEDAAGVNEQKDPDQALEALENRRAALKAVGILLAEIAQKA